jgi:tagatose 6-phosphate kinase
MVLCVGTTPAAQRVMRFGQLRLNQVNRALTTIDGPAGKSINVAKVLHALGARPLALGFLGGARGDFIAGHFAKQNIAGHFIRVKTPTRQCLTILDDQSGEVTELVEESGAVTGGEYRRLFHALRSIKDPYRALVLSGTLAPGVPEDLYAQALSLAKKRGALTVVDARGAPLLLALAQRPDVVKPNHAELAATVGSPLKTRAQLIQAMDQVRKRGPKSIVVTCGKAPALAMNEAGIWSIQPPAVEALNPIGSGDAFTAGLVWALIRKEPFPEACRWGAAAGAANALTLMAGDVRRSDVEHLAGKVQVQKL